MSTEMLGGRIKTLRLKMGWTQRRLAAAVGIHVGYLSKIERNQVDPPSEKVISRLAAALDSDEDELMYLASKLPEDIEELLVEEPEIPAILRRTRGLSKESWLKLDRYIQRLREEEGEEPQEAMFDET